MFVVWLNINVRDKQGSAFDGISVQVGCYIQGISVTFTAYSYSIFIEVDSRRRACRMVCMSVGLQGYGHIIILGVDVFVCYCTLGHQ